MGYTSSLKKNALLNIIYKLSSMIFPLIVYPYVSRILMSENMGRVAFFSNMTSYGLLVGSIGISTYGIRAVAKSRDNRQELAKTVKELFIINSIITGLVLLFLACSVVWVNKFKMNQSLFIISLAQIAVAPFSMEWLFGGLEKFEYITKRAIFFKIVSLGLIFGFVHNKNDYVIYALIVALSSCGNYICNFVYSRKFVTVKVNGKCELKKHLKPSLTLFASLLAVSIYTSLDLLMLGFVKGDVAVGLYDVAVKAKTVLLSLINAISGVLLPRLSYYVYKKDKQLYEQTIKKAIITILMIVIPFTLFFEIESFDTIMILGGNDYSKAVPCMMILMPILLISGVSNIMGNQILIPNGLEKYYTKAVVCGAIVDIILNIVLMPRFSIYGAATATLLAEFVQMTVQIYHSRTFLRNKLKFSEILKVIIATLVSGGFVFGVRTMLNSNYLVNICICFVLFVCIYIISLRIMKIKDSVD